ncbi:hypothetical protein EO087_12005 [Dyella sp. M7H15-1]|uniref:hypothetical protein n=1 Tax=Dyella sp. M7H15-1 TaxID=2501295 RepID=UPI001004FE26|nr:hypothetical protein [Dyella sp. M7H15-1]QAU24626.1 hypothetical protein EO087_12005 [Dyella sp. M7H15-1]
MKKDTIEKILALLFLAAAFEGCRATAGPDAGVSSTLANGSNEFEGRWSPNCERFEGFKVGNNLRANFVINSNQININIHLKISGVEDNLISIYFDSPSDLGRGGINLDWADFSKNIPIAIGEIDGKNSMRLNWSGFYNTKSFLYQWVNQPDFYEKRNVILFHRCAS